MRDLRMLALFFLGISSPLSSMGCATLLSGTSQELSVQSQPAAAEVKVETRQSLVLFQGKTPASFTLKTNRPYTVTVRAPGYQPAEIEVTKTFNEMVIANLLCLPALIICGGVDWFTGAWYKLAPGEMMVQLVPGNAPSPPGQPGAPATPVPAIPAPQAHESVEGVDLYAVIAMRDSEGELRAMRIPLVREVH